MYRSTAVKKLKEHHVRLGTCPIRHQEAQRPIASHMRCWRSRPGRVYASLCDEARQEKVLRPDHDDRQDGPEEDVPQECAGELARDSASCT